VIDYAGADDLHSASARVAPFDDGVFRSSVAQERPERVHDSDRSNPIEQVYGYIEELKGGRIVDRRGRTLSVPAHTPFYASILRDLTPTLKNMARFAGLTQTPDCDDDFGDGSNDGVSVEIISCNKLDDDTKKQNAVLFEKLGLGSWTRAIGPSKV